MDEMDLNVRAQWKMTLALLMLCGSLFAVFFTLNDPVLETLSDSMKHMVIVQFLVFNSLYYYVLYRCAYKNPGTKLLKFLSFVVPLALIVNILGYAVGTVPLPVGTLSQVYTVFGNLLSLRFVFLHRKMIKINQKLKGNLSF